MVCIICWCIFVLSLTTNINTMAQHQSQTLLQNLYERFFNLVEYKTQIEKLEIETGLSYEDNIRLINNITESIATVRRQINKARLTIDECTGTCPNE